MGPLKGNYGSAELPEPWRSMLTYLWGTSNMKSIRRARAEVGLLAPNNGSCGQNHALRWAERCCLDDRCYWKVHVTHINYQWYLGRYLCSKKSLHASTEVTSFLWLQGCYCLFRIVSPSPLRGVRETKSKRGVAHSGWGGGSIKGNGNVCYCRYLK